MRFDPFCVVECSIMSCKSATLNLHQCPSLLACMCKRVLCSLLGSAVKKEKTSDSDTKHAHTH